ncbi:hypothetical protein HK104_001951 [Borealophlyctis nickersoniae]|nr:hypothetical protein HK104_001951 [Borealophlyctis nickersoniae]
MNGGGVKGVYVNNGYFYKHGSAKFRRACTMTGDAADALGYSFRNAVCMEELCRRELPDGSTFPQMVKIWVEHESPEVFFEVAAASPHILRILIRFVTMVIPKIEQCGQFTAPLFTGEWYYLYMSPTALFNFNAVIRKGTNLLDEGNKLVVVRQIANECWFPADPLEYTALDALGRFLKGEVSWKIHLSTSPTGVILDETQFPSIFSYKEMDEGDVQADGHYIGLVIFRQCTLKCDVGGSSSGKCLKRGSKVEKISFYISDDYQGFMDFLGGPVIKNAVSLPKYERDGLTLWWRVMRELKCQWERKPEAGTQRSEPRDKGLGPTHKNNLNANMYWTGIE